MTNAHASKYARTLFDAVPDADRARIASDLEAFVAGVNGHAELAAVFANPAVPVDRKSAIASAVASQAGLHSAVVSLVGLLGTHDQLGALPDLTKAYRSRLNAHLRIVEAKVTTSVPLSTAQADELQKSLSAASGLDVRLTSAVDPAMIGGVIAQIGSTVYDGSVARQLEKMRAALSEDA